ncbi:hypothetical protein, conserved [Babesia ovata]|uniref:C3H1-type domain-containing protein n=1 Tax=Babesia ovata TaxID=189622 RepID=A0A2H6KJY7_9APIC|nr:uncharacterized protein BOVATA_047910 [Babesia ovata]GBE63298.1 hypothetical protein, conserved [Babesia ovata]
MSFLHGVLESVKEDDNVATYDNDSQNNITSVIETLNNSVGKGRQAFGKAVTQVSEWLKKHGEQVDTLTTGVSFELGKYVEDVSRQRDKPLADQLRSWTQTLSQIDADLTSLHSNNISQLDPVLRDKLMHKIEPVKSAVQVLKESAGKGELEKQVREVDETIFMQFSEIGKKIGQLREQKNEQINAVNKSLMDATDALLGAGGVKFDEECKTQITGKFTDIKWAVGNVYDTLKNKKVQLENLVETARREFGELTNAVKGNGAKVGNVSVDHNWSELQKKIKELVTGLRNKDNPTTPGDLDKIVSGLQAYGWRFNKYGEFETSVLKGWLNGVFDKHPVKQYVESIGNTNPAALGKVRSVITTYITTMGGHATKTRKFTESVTENLNYIQPFFNDFATRVDPDQTDYMVDYVHSQLQKNSHGLRFNTDRSVLEPAAKSILSCVYAAARQAANELKSITSTTDPDGSVTYNLGTNVDEAIKKVDEIRKQFDVGNFGHTVDKALGKAKEKINLLGDVLKEKEAVGSMLHKLEDIQKEVIEKLEKLQNDDVNTEGSIEKIGKAAADKMEELKSILVAKLSDIGNAVIDADQRLTQAINNVINEVNTAQDNITNSVRSLFAEQHVADLTALHTLVERKLAEVRKIIDEDKVTGVKGLFKALSGASFTFENRLPKFSESTSSMNILTKLEKAFPKPAMAVKETNDHATKFKETVQIIKHYSNRIFTYMLNDMEALLVSQIATRHAYKTKVEKIKKAHNDVLDSIYITKHFDHEFVNLLDTLRNILGDLSPQEFGALPYVNLDALKAGMTQFTEQLSHAYVNKYSGKRFGPLTEQDKTKKPADKVLSAEGRNCAKVCLTILERVKGDLDGLRSGCKKRFSKSTISRSSDLGELFKSYGYRVASHSKSQDGELKRHEDMTGEKVFQKLHEMKLQNTEKIKHLKDCESIEKDEHGNKKKHDNFDIFDLLKCLHRHLEEYYSVGHIATFTSKKTPCSVNEMLSWFSGLPYNAAYSTLLRDGFTSLLQKPKPKTIQGGDEFEVELDDLKSYYIDAYPNRITYDHINTALDHICSISYDILTSIAGHGDEYTTYAADFCTNHLSLSYPSIPSQCLDMLLDILRRLLPQLRYLFNRCKLSTKHSGWSQCLYGRDVFTTKSPCNNHSNSKPNSRPKCQPTCQANTKPNCQPTSPLMSYLTDSLPGHLPHDVSSIGCRSVCSTCPNGKKGMPCLTPLGFRGFSGSTRKGEEICDILDKFFSNFYLSSLFCLSPKTPASLPEQFGFVLSLVSGWNSPKTEATSRIKKSVESSIESVSINLYDQPTKLTAALTNAYRNTHSNHGGKDHLPAYSDVYSLAMTSACNDRVGKALCAPYVASLCGDTYAYFAEKHCNTYLSWAIYLPWTFWDLLNNLYNAFCSITCADWGCRGCLRGDKCRSGKHGVVEDEKKADDTCQCSSIVQCKGVSSTFYQYGFSFGEASTLNSGDTVKKCKDFCSQLHKVLHSNYFGKLFEQCDEYLRIIRWPFMCLLLALWSLSLLYLLHIAVVRLDVLRIRSHLKSPASHRIAAQSLLAAARLKALANVKYFSP